MSDSFFARPILNSPYAYPSRHWELDEHGQPTELIVDTRRKASFVTPVPRPKKQKGRAKQEELDLGDETGVSTKKQKYDQTGIINEVRSQVDIWRALAPAQWQVPTKANPRFVAVLTS